MTSATHSISDGQSSPWHIIEKMYIRTRGPLPVRPTQVSGRYTSIMDLVQGIRKQVGALPLTFVLHDWGAPDTAAFLSDLQSVVIARDTIWLVPAEGRQQEAPAIGRLLDLKSQRDNSLYQMMIGDVVYFSGTQPDSDRVPSWRMRCRCLIIEDDRQYSVYLKAMSVRMECETYLRSSEGLLREV